MSLEGCRSRCCPAAEERALYSFREPRRHFSLSLSWTSGYGRSYSLSANVRTKLYRRYSSQPPLLLQILQNWQGTDLLACNRLVKLPEGGHSANVTNLRKYTFVTINYIH